MVVVNGLVVREDVVASVRNLKEYKLDGRPVFNADFYLNDIFIAEVGYDFGYFYNFKGLAEEVLFDQAREIFESVFNDGKQMEYDYLLFATMKQAKKVETLEERQVKRARKARQERLAAQERRVERARQTRKARLAK